MGAGHRYYRLIEFCKQCMCSTVHSPMESGSPTDDPAKRLMASVRDQLLQGLTDDAESIRQVVTPASVHVELLLDLLLDQSQIYTYTYLCTVEYVLYSHLVI